MTLVQEVAYPRHGPSLVEVGEGKWEAGFERPPVDRLEYRFEVAVAPHHHELILDPANPLRAPGAFGERSVIEFPEYEAPAWVSTEVEAGAVIEIDVPSELLGEVQPTRIWSAAGADPAAPLPLLVALDGLEFDRFSGLLRLLDAEVAGGRLPPMRAALCHPTRRGDHYAANPDFAGYLARELIPAVGELVALRPERRYRVGLGASLGGLAVLHAHRLEPETFGGLLLQSAAFLHHGHVMGDSTFQRIEEFVSELLATPAWDDPVPLVMTCGTVEQNLVNNRECASALAIQGYPAALQVVRDAHNWIAWRDAWTPYLVDLLGRLWT